MAVIGGAFDSVSSACSCARSASGVVSRMPSTKPIIVVDMELRGIVILKFGIFDDLMDIRKPF